MKRFAHRSLSGGDGSWPIYSPPARRSRTAMFTDCSRPCCLFVSQTAVSRTDTVSDVPLFTGRQHSVNIITIRTTSHWFHSYRCFMRTPRFNITKQIVEICFKQRVERYQNAGLLLILLTFIMVWTFNYFANQIYLPLFNTQLYICCPSGVSFPQIDESSPRVICTKVRVEQGGNNE